MPKFQYIHELITYSFDAFSRRMACDDLHSSLSYTELEEKSKSVQKQLKKFNVNSSFRVGLCTSKSVDSFASLLAILNGEWCLVPIDSLSPFARKAQIIKDSKLGGLITERSFVDEMVVASEKMEVYPIEGTNLFYLSFPDQQTECRQDLAYILYTSGSTGAPKGVMITHENALSFVQWVADRFDFSEQDVFASVAPFHFDLSIFDIFVALWHGSEVILFNENHIRNPMMLSSIIEQKRITIWYSTPTVLMLMNQYGKMHKYNHSSIRKVYYAGEVFPVESLKAMSDKWSQADFYNFYGPTETNVCTWTEVPKTVDLSYDTAIIGDTCDHLGCKVYFENQVQDLTAGLEGELVVTGSAVSPGYIGIASDSHLQCEEKRWWYKTGDWVHVTNDLNFRFLGRKDRMVKRRGYRIELDEIQKAIEDYSGVHRAGVVDCTANGIPTIKAFYEKNSSAFDIEELKQFLVKRIPNYMLPDRWEFMDKLPLTSTHKVDYQLLSKL